MTVDGFSAVIGTLTGFHAQLALVLGKLVIGSVAAPAGPVPSDPIPTNAGAPKLQFDIGGDSVCPRPVEVSAELQKLVTLAADHGITERVLVLRRENAIEIEFRAANGELLGSRSLAPQGTCEELSSAVAVIVASWLGAAHPELGLWNAQNAAAEPAAPPRKEVPPRAAPTPARRTPVVRAAVLPPASEPRRSDRGWRFSPAVGFGATISSEGVSLLTSFGAALVHDQSGLGWWLGASLSGAQEEPLGVGVVRYSRWPAMTGPLFRFGTAPLRAEVGAGGAVAWLSIEGEGFPRDRSTNDLTWGPFAMSRLFLTNLAPPIHPFVGATGIWWAKEAVAYVDSLGGDTVTLSPLELLITVGISVDL